MPFQLDTAGLPPIDSYVTALARWETTAPWKNTSDPNVRPLDNSRRKKHTTIRKLADGSIACKLHYTDVVIWRPDNSFTLTPYTSTSTDNFAKSLTPSGILPSFITSPYSLVMLGGRQDGHLIQLKGATRFVSEDTAGGAQAWTPAPGAELDTFKLYRMDRKRASAALKKYNYSAFVDWYTVRQALLYGASQTWLGGEYVSVAAVLLEGPEGWLRLANNNLQYNVAFLANIKNKIYAAEKVADAETFASIPVKLLPTIRRSQHMSGWAL